MAISNQPISTASLSSEPDSGVSGLNLVSGLAGASLEKALWLWNYSGGQSGSALAEFGTGFMSISGVGATTVLNFERARSFISSLGSSSVLDTQLTGNIQLSDALGAADEAAITHVLELLSSAGLSGTPTIEHAKVIAFLSQLAGVSAEDNNVTFAVNLAAAMTVRSLESYGWDFDAESGAGIAAAFESRYNAVFEALSQMSVASELATGQQIGMVFSSGGSGSSEYGTQAELHLDLFDALAGRVIYQLGDDVYQGWVFSVEHAAFTEYSNYPFNSMTMYRGKAYGVADDGIYLLEGDDDAGTPIDAAIRTKLSNFRQRTLKRCDAAYIGYTSSGKMVLKVVVERDGTLHEHWYQEKLGATDGMRTGRVKIQKGLRSTYWQFELANQEGADFDIEDVTIKYELLSRRIK